MKNIYISILFLFASTISMGQSLFVEGLELNYAMIFFDEPQVVINTARIKGDTMLLGQSCSIMEFDQPTCDYANKINYIKEQGDSMLYFNESLNEFKLLYDFSAEVGDTIKIDFWDPALTMDSTFYALVEAVDSIMVGPSFQKRIHVRYDAGENGEVDFSDSYYTASWIQGLGSTTNFFHFSILGFCDATANRCLQSIVHPDLGEETINNCLSGIEDLDLTSVVKMKIWPNPAFDEISMKLDLNLTNERTIVQVVGLDGKIVSNEMRTSYEDGDLKIDVKDLGPSMYVVVLRDEDNKIVATTTFVKR